MTFEEAKDQIAKKSGYLNWEELEVAQDRSDNFRWILEDKHWKEAAELHAESRAKDAWERACDATIDEVKSTINDEYNYEFVKPPYQP